jgi:hypothetical protein
MLGHVSSQASTRCNSQRPRRRYGRSRSKLKLWKSESWMTSSVHWKSPRMAVTLGPEGVVFGPTGGGRAESRFGPAFTLGRQTCSAAAGSFRIR